MASLEDRPEPESKEKSFASDKTMDDKYNVEAAEIRANEALRLPISEAIPIYEQLLTLFPTAAKYWKQYVEAHMAVNNDDATKQIFSRCLLNCFQVPLWRCYIRFIRKANDKKGLDGQDETKKAFDFMLSYVGVSYHSTLMDVIDVYTVLLWIGLYI
ncbi:HAT (Half-A-TPR) repeat [Parasponia andersonii]|uniref:HAT (Half-A-TPR) repeat n=1 Tax=Parasponia andersonii TaxID=3476 RepID=A0A2P5D3R3_PARAD|nr:HAT (Half-A-TPR) repeat [Parasponia andersonii]